MMKVKTVAQRQARRSQTSNGMAPISSHRLFSAIVALWFAALFGLGTLVLPTILLERAMTTTGFASLVSAAAPPLGVTARIAISLTAAILGAVLGSSIARRVASAQAAARPANLERRFSAAKRPTASGARKPISAKEELGDEPVATAEAPAPQQMQGRRRALAIAEDNRPSDFLPSAPLPGEDSLSGDAHPMMPSMDVVARREAARRDGVLERFAREPEDPEPLVLNELVEVQPVGNNLAALKNSAPAEAAGQAPVPPGIPAAEVPQQFAPPVVEEPVRQFDRPQAAIQPPVGQAAPASPVAAPQETPPVEPVTLPFARPAAQPAQAPEQAAPFVAPAETPRPFAQPSAVTPEAVAPFAQPQEFIPQAPAPVPAPVQDFSVPSPAAQATAADPLAPFRAPVFDEDDADFEEHSAIAANPFAAPATPAPAEPAPVAEPVDAFEPVAAEEDDEPLAFFAPSQTRAAPVEEAAPLHELGIIELAERLSRSMLGHAKPVSAPPAEAFAAIAAAIAEPTEIEFEPETTEQAESFTEVEIEAVEPAIPQAFEQPQVEADAPRAFDQPGATAAPPVPVVPEALRPLDLEFEATAEAEQEDDLSLSFPTAAPAPLAATDTAQPEVPAAFEALEADDEDDEPQENYGSLLAMKNPFRGQAEYVRIEEPEPEEGAIEPAVVFPGQAPISETPLPFARPTETRAEEPTSIAEPAPQPASDVRLFDAPNEKVAKLAPAPQRAKIDPAEAERALRSALATLQRMSGAA